MNAWVGQNGEIAEYTFETPKMIKEIRLIFDSCFNRDYHNMPCYYPLEEPLYKLPEILIRDYKVVGMCRGEEFILAEVTNNRRRLVRHSVGVMLDAIQIIPMKTWGHPEFRIFAMDIY